MSGQPVLGTTRTKQISPPRITAEVHEWLVGMSSQTGLSMSALVSALLDHAMRNGWTVKPLAVQEATMPP